MKESNELFELCKQVYEATGWKYTIGRFHDDGSYDGYVGHRGIAYTPNPQNAKWLPKDIPLYTSDYLLEKLPPTIKNKFDGDDDYLILYKKTGSWYADYMGQFLRCNADTPLKALLKLTIALSEAGELK